MAEKLRIHTFTLGDFQTNCFIVRLDGRPGCWIVDAGFEPEEMIAFIQRERLEPEALLLTHAHCDHIAGVGAVGDHWPQLPILIHQAEATFLRDPMLNLSALMGSPIKAPAATGYLEHGATLELGPVRFQVRHTPGHSPGGVTLYCAGAGVALVGDTLFAGSIGRYDFPTSDGRQLLESIRGQLLTLPDETTIHPGHGPASTIGQERETNPFLQPQ